MRRFNVVFILLASCIPGPLVANAALHRRFEYEAMRGMVKIVRQFIERGIDINATDALVRAADWNRVEVIELLLAQPHININKADIYGRTPLFIAAERGYAHVVELLILAGADVDKADSYGRIPWYVAHSNGHFMISTMLIYSAKT
ncbi:MAG: ankyrin repeat domain-containing protein [Candidatus Dependentiae bacterium]|nr:ankyrin repeat domain-containing protein [Candidatus Dependentiae bacterium]